MEAIEDGFGSGGGVLAGLASPEADFEARVVRCESGLVSSRVSMVWVFIGFCGWWLVIGNQCSVISAQCSVVRDSRFGSRFRFLRKALPC